MTDDGGELDPEQSLAFLREYVETALLNKQSGSSSEHYDNLVAEVRELKSLVVLGEGLQGAAIAAAQLATVLSAASGCVSKLHHAKHRALLQELLDFRPWAFPQVVRSAALDLAVHVVVAQGSLAHYCLEALVLALLPPPGPPASDEELGQAWQVEQGAAEVQDAVVAALERMLSLVPTAPTRVLPLLASSAPHKLRDRTTQCLYLRAVFALAQGPAGVLLRDVVLVNVVEHLLGVDVEIRWQEVAEPGCEAGLEEEGSSSEEEEDLQLFELEDMTQGLHLGSSSNVAATQVAAAQPAAERVGWEGAAAGGEVGADQGAKPAVDVTADKLDAMMELTLQHLEWRWQQGQGRQAWAALLNAFERSLLHVHRSKFTQFLLFHSALLDPAHCVPSLIALLLRRVTDQSQPAITRGACAAYLSSFLARAAFVPEQQVVSTLECMTEWAAHYLKTEGASTSAAPAAGAPMQAPLLANQFSSAGPGGPHLVFYAMMQGIMYVLCYHLHRLLVSRAHSTNSAGVCMSVDLASRTAALVKRALPPLLSSHLAPLYVCAPSVVTEFSRQAAQLRLIDCSTMPGSGQRDNNDTREKRPLETFFPFDPYLLRRSARFLQLKASYVRWSHGHVAGAAIKRGDAAVLDEEEEEEDGMAGDGTVYTETEPDASSSSSSSDDSASNSGTDSESDDGPGGGSSLGEHGLHALAAARMAAAAAQRGPSFALTPAGPPLMHTPGLAAAASLPRPILSLGGKATRKGSANRSIGGASLSGGSSLEGSSLEGTSPQEPMSPSPYGKSVPMLGMSHGTPGAVPMFMTLQH